MGRDNLGLYGSGRRDARAARPERYVLDVEPIVAAAFRKDSLGPGDDGDWREGCEDCLRRTSPGGPMSPWIEAPVIVVFECEYRIGAGDYQ